MSHELVHALVQCGIKGKLSRRAEDLERRGVTRQDVLRVYQHIIDSAGHAPAAASRVLDTMLDGDGWDAAVQAARDATRTAPTSSSGKPLRVARRGGIDVHEERIREYMADGCTREEAEHYELGGYLHEAICGDNKRPHEAGAPHKLDPWDVVQIASTWAQRFGGGTGTLRRRLKAMASLHRVTAKKWAFDDADKQRNLEQADALDQLLAGVPEKVEATA